MIKLLKFTFIYLFFFLIGDIVVSNFFIKTKIENNCYEQLGDFYRLKKIVMLKKNGLKNLKVIKFILMKMDTGIMVIKKPI